MYWGRGRLFITWSVMSSLTAMWSSLNNCHTVYSYIAYNIDLGCYVDCLCEGLNVARLFS